MEKNRSRVAHCVDHCRPTPSRGKDGAPASVIMPARSRAWASRRRSNPTLQKTKGGAPGSKASDSTVANTPVARLPKNSSTQRIRHSKPESWSTSVMGIFRQLSSFVLQLGFEVDGDGGIRGRLGGYSSSARRRSGFARIGAATSTGLHRRSSFTSRPRRLEGRPWGPVGRGDCNQHVERL